MYDRAMYLRNKEAVTFRAARRKIHFKAAWIRAGQNLCLHDSFVWLKMKGTSLDL